MLHALLIIIKESVQYKTNMIRIHGTIIPMITTVFISTVYLGNYFKKYCFKIYLIKLNVSDYCSDIKFLKILSCVNIKEIIQ